MNTAVSCDLVPHYQEACFAPPVLSVRHAVIIFTVSFVERYHHIMTYPSFIWYKTCKWRLLLHGKWTYLGLGVKNICTLCI